MGEDECQVLIVGAGPAGCAAGIRLAREGVRVQILEKEAPAHHKTCGDLLGPRSLWMLDGLGLGYSPGSLQAMDLHAVSVFDETGLKSWGRFSGNAGERGAALAVRRDIFDRYLQAQAILAGCRIRYGVRFRSFESMNRHSVRCQAKGDGGAVCHIRANVILGSDGVRSSVALAAGLIEKPRKGKIVLAVRGYFRKVRGLGDSIELYLLKKYLPGYAWVIPVGPDTANVGLGIRADVLAGKGLRLRSELARFVGGHPAVAKRMRSAEVDGSINGWPIGVYDKTRRRSAGHVLLLGDAGSLADPLTGEGVYAAMKSAFLASPIVLEALAREDYSKAQLVRYDREVRRVFDKEYRFASFLSSLPSDHLMLQPLVRWGLKRVENSSIMDPEYGAVVGGYFTGLLPRRRVWSSKWFRRTFLG